MSEDNTVSIHNFIENDPCHGCDYAKLKEKIDNPFERRYCCTNVDRVHYTLKLAMTKDHCYSC